jgi:hypothetical protein
MEGAFKEDDRQQIMQVNDEILRWMKEFKPSSVTSSDVYEI